MRVLFRNALLLAASSAWCRAQATFDSVDAQLAVDAPAPDCFCVNSIVPDERCCPESLLRTQAVTPLTPAELAAFSPFLRFAQSTYCPPEALEGWRCGRPCDEVPGFRLTLLGGNGDSIQRYFVGHWVPRNTIVVAHQGTDPTRIFSILNNANLLLGEMNPLLFPGAPADVRAHEGFLDEHAGTIGAIFEHVKHLMAETGVTKIACVGHSLGGALAQLDALYFSLHLPSTIDIVATTFATPRVGNAAFVAFYETKVQHSQRVNNKRDPVPILPGRSLGYRHTSGEVHILGEGNAVACPGHDNTDVGCQIGSVPSILVSNVLDHFGPYEGILLGTFLCR